MDSFTLCLKAVDSSDSSILLANTAIASLNTAQGKDEQHLGEAYVTQYSAVIDSSDRDISFKIKRMLRCLPGLSQILSLSSYAILNIDEVTKIDTSIN